MIYKYLYKKQNILIFVSIVFIIIGFATDVFLSYNAFSKDQTYFISHESHTGLRSWLYAGNEFFSIESPVAYIFMIYLSLWCFSVFLLLLSEAYYEKNRKLSYRCLGISFLGCVSLIFKSIQHFFGGLSWVY